MIKVSYIIKFKNEAGHIENCADSILSQKGDFTHELIFVNNNTTDSSIDYVRGLVKNPPKNATVKYLEIDKFTYASSSNMGLEAASGEYVCIATAHAYFKDENALSKMIVNFADPEVVLVSPRLLVPEGSSSMARAFKQNANQPYKIIKSKKYFSVPADSERIGNYPFMGTMCLLRGSVVHEQKNWFHELPRSEDLEWCYRMINAGYTCVYEPESLVTHDDRDPIDEGSGHAFKVANRWLTAVTAIILIKTKKVPSKMHLLRSSLISLIPFMLNLIVRGPGIANRFRYLGMLLVASWHVARQALFHYNEYAKWEKLYLESFVTPAKAGV
jgi:glycosyltransferase involved in cell wall biosynthesis